MKVWLALDPETERVTAQESEFGDGSFPAGKRGRGWRVRQGDIDDETWEAMMRGELSPDEQDAVHHRAWERATT